MKHPNLFDKFVQALEQTCCIHLHIVHVVSCKNSPTCKTTQASIDVVSKRVLALLEAGEISEAVAQELLPHPLDFYKTPPPAEAPRGVKRQISASVLSEETDTTASAAAGSATGYVVDPFSGLCLGLNVASTTVISFLTQGESAGSQAQCRAQGKVEEIV